MSCLWTAKNTHKIKGCEIPGDGGCLIEAACNDSSGGDDVEDGEDSDLDHQLLQLVDLGPALLLLDHTPEIKLG